MNNKKCLRPHVGGQSRSYWEAKAIRCECPKHEHITLEYAKEHGFHKSVIRRIEEEQG